MFGWISSKFSRKLSFAIALVFVSAMLLADFLVIRVLQNQLIAELAGNIKSQAAVAALSAESPVTLSKKTIASRNLISRLRQACDCRVTFIDTRGVVIGDSEISEESLDKIENHKNRPEIKAALEGRPALVNRHSETTGQDYLYAASSIAGRGGAAGVVRLALPLTQIHVKTARLRRAVALVFLLVLGVSLLCVFWLSRSFFNPLSEIVAVAQQLADGQYGARLRRLPKDDMRQLGIAFNGLADKIEQDIKRLSGLEEVRKDFVANVSHELRTPLTAIKAFAETLRLGALDDVKNRGEFIAEIEKNADRMNRLVDDLLELSAMESGRRRPVKEPVSFMKVAAESVAGLKPLAEKKRIVIKMEPLHGLPEFSADRNQIKQVFANILDNAIKYTGGNGTIYIGAAAKDGRLTVSIGDTGEGIAPEHLPRIFERFYRADKARSREIGGTGLGLAIVKHIVEAHGGAVGVESKPGQGSRFFFSLPLT
ncbi:MAG: HAMP domain-containing protein [Elusimicrobia bacterium]|nr:HAMP domain-containing protein [Elusimicrobiota bacterium]